ncbi:helix-turn-helix domain-containing protein [Spirulina sp. CCNP1310]|uniref:helix-turn-helix domain-containing protein n=1 Tax=Spirulina sp. CCNP1310 TaxID=3110249 RepID=UPI003A4C52A5
MRENNTNQPREEITLKSLREHSGLTQRQVAERLGLSLGAIQKWEQNGGYPSLENAARLAKVLGVSLDTLAIAFRLTGNGRETT